MDKQNFLQFAMLALFAVGFLLVVSSSQVITGAAVGSGQSEVITPLAGLLLMAVGGMILASKGTLDKKVEKIGRLYYEAHAIERMGQRKMFPTVIEDVVGHGEHYRLKHMEDFGEAKGATDMYLMRAMADIVPGGRIGERILHVREPTEKRKWENVIVLTDRKKTVKTVYAANDSGLKAFFKAYID